MKLEGENSIVGKSMILHANEDDLKTQPTGNAGARIACGLIEAKS
jgi:Cu-Zn family superoxide dismutase